MNDALDKYIAERISALREQVAERRQRVYLIYHRTRGDWERSLFGIYGSPEGAGRGLGLLLKEEHPGEQLELQVISDNTVIYDASPIPAGEAWVTQNGSMMVTRQLVAEVEVHEVNE